MQYMQAAGIGVMQAAVDVDTLSVAAALLLARSCIAPVEVYAEDTDILAMLLYHCIDCMSDIYFCSYCKRNTAVK